MNNYKEIYKVTIKQIGKDEIVEEFSLYEVALCFYNDKTKDVPIAYASVDRFVVVGGIQQDYADVRECYIKEIYIESEDMTIIVLEKTENGYAKSTEIKGFYYGKPNSDNTLQYYGKLKAEY